MTPTSTILLSCDLLARVKWAHEPSNGESTSIRERVGFMDFLAYRGCMAWSLGTKMSHR